MTYDLALALIGFAFVSSITPGPNNLMLMASGANYGLRRTLPHMFGVSFGHGLMVFIIGLGLLRVFEEVPLVRTALSLICTAYLVYLAYRIATAAAPGEADASGKPLSALQAAAFQWVNPKAIYMGITAQTYYAPDLAVIPAAAWVAGLFIMTNLPSVSVWAWGGTKVRAFLTGPRELKAFNWTMAALLLATVIPIFLG